MRVFNNIASPSTAASDRASNIWISSTVNSNRNAGAWFPEKMNNRLPTPGKMFTKHQPDRIIAPIFSICQVKSKPGGF